MMQKDKKLVIVFLVILFGICLCIPCKFVLVKIGVMSMNMDNFLEYKEKDVNNVVDKINNVVGRIENSVENKVTNYFPFYNVINSLYDKVDFTSNKILFKDVPIKKNSDGEYIFYDKVNEFYYLTNKYTSKELDERLDSQVKFFNNLSKKKIDVNIYIPTRYEFTTLKKDNLSNYVGEFVSKLDSNINVRVMDVKSIDEYKEYFYKTDHHWTIKGALDGYKDICDMLNIDAINNLNIVKHKERMYYGSLAKTALNDNINDDKVAKLDEVFTLLSVFLTENEDVKIQKTSVPMIVYAIYKAKKDHKSVERLMDKIKEFVETYDNIEEYKSYVVSGTSSPESVKNRTNYWRAIVNKL